MSALRVLHVDDEPDIRELVGISLGLDPEFTVRSCSSGTDAIAAAADWSPDLILLDVMMPGMDGPTTLERMRETPHTKTIPVIFMTASTQASELDRFRVLGVDRVISKPFDPLTLSTSVRQLLMSPQDRLADARVRFLQRARVDANALTRDRKALADKANATVTFELIKSVAHKLAGGGGTVGYAEIGAKALTLEQAASDMLKGTGTIFAVNRNLKALVEVIERA
jgi:two-component system OmpR family response regulator